jgi:hypothetical protein
MDANEQFSQHARGLAAMLVAVADQIDRCGGVPPLYDAEAMKAMQSQIAIVKAHLESFQVVERPHSNP